MQQYDFEDEEIAFKIGWSTLAFILFFAVNFVGIRF